MALASASKPTPTSSGVDQIYKKGWILRKKLQRFTKKAPDESQENEKSRWLRRLSSLRNFSEEDTSFVLETEKKEKKDKQEHKQGQRLKKLASMGSLAGGERRTGQGRRRLLASSRDRLHSILK